MVTPIIISIVLFSIATIGVVAFFLYIKRNDYFNHSKKTTKIEEKLERDSIRITNGALEISEILLNGIVKIIELSEEVDPVSSSSDITASKVREFKNEVISKFEDDLLISEFKLFSNAYYIIDGILMKMKIESPFVLKKLGIVKELNDFIERLKSYKSLIEFENVLKEENEKGVEQNQIYR